MFVSRIFVLICCLILYKNQINAAMSSVKIIRNQSILPHAERVKPEISVNSRSSSSSSFASDTSSRAASTSRRVTFVESEIHPLVERTKSKQAVIPHDLNRALDEAMESTNNMHLDPSRDGVHARVRSALARFGAAAAVGSVIGTGVGVIVDQHFNRANITQTPLIPSTTIAPSSTKSESDDYNNI